MVVSAQLHTPATLSPGKEPPVPTELEAGWLQIWSGHCGRENVNVNIYPLIVSIGVFGLDADIRPACFHWRVSCRTMVINGPLDAPVKCDSICLEGLDW
jgi:hypothetical protein